MTTHVFIVDETTFHYHLEYMFAGTGAKELIPSFITNPQNTFPQRKEKLLSSMLADCSRVRKNDNVIFYLQSKNGREGCFYGIFKVDSDPFLDLLGKNNQYLSSAGLRKCLPFRVKIRPNKVYPRGVTEWTALDDIDGLNSPSKMIWSLIYRKMRGNRGNTMITLYEAERLLTLIKAENQAKPLVCKNFSFDLYKREIIPGQNVVYSGQSTKINILPCLIERFNSKKPHESHLQSYISGNLENNASLLSSLGIKSTEIEWIGNEMFCGVGMQKIDIAISTCTDDDERSLYVIELKDELSSEKNFAQISKYVKWVKQYYFQNTPCLIQPVLISREPQRQRVKKKLLLISNERNSFNTSLPKECLPIKLIEYTICNNDIKFTSLP